ncbi:uncharacterized protein LOC134855558 [Symsagittifera roscoffensis]|uniref:uncharacterized protein LOC134855558 n=1 Tax=Symsagittifera roscoffensis TaxID=84072 RepID=UPI00307C83CD
MMMMIRLDDLLVLFSVSLFLLSIPLSLCDCELKGGSTDDGTGTVYISGDMHKLLESVATVSMTTESKEYTLDLCPSVADSTAVKVVTNDSKETKLGISSKVQSAFKGCNWALISFGSDENYTETSCKDHPRRSVVHITCNASLETDNKLRHAQDFSHTGECYYLFEVESKSAQVCPDVNEQSTPTSSDSPKDASEQTDPNKGKEEESKATNSDAKPEESEKNSSSDAQTGGAGNELDAQTQEPSSGGGVSFFTVLFIVLLLGVFFYFAIGILYKRIALDARGWEQLPNSNVWVGLVDKCVGVLDRLRYGSSAGRSDRYYNNIDTGAPPFGEEMGPESTDDHLLSM